MPTIQDRFRCRRGTAAALAAANEVPLDSEIVLESDTGLGKIGNGITHWNDLLYTILGDVDLSELAAGKTIVRNAANDGWELADGGSGSVQSVVAGTNIDVDNSDAANPVVSSTLGTVSLKGRKSDYASLPTSPTPSAGDAYLVDEDNLIYVWNGMDWPMQGDGFGGEPRNQRTKSWRLLITKGNAPLVGGNFVAIQEMEFYSVSGGANLCTGGTPFASSSYSSDFVAADAFNGDKTKSTTPHDCWASANTVASWNAPHFLGYMLGVASNVYAFKIWNRLNSNQAPPRDFILQSSRESTDGFNGQWIDEIVVTDQTGWSAGEAREFTR